MRNKKPPDLGQGKDLVRKADQGEKRMVTFEAAKKMANDIYPVDQYTEYTDAYVFSAKKII